MLGPQVAHKYARALFLAVLERNLLDQAYDQSKDLANVFDENDKLLQVLSGPTLSEDDKIGLIRRVFGDRMERLYVEFLIVVIRKRRSKYLPEILHELTNLIEEKKGITRATVVTAIELGSDTEEKLINRLETVTSNKILLEKKVDSSIMGGMIVRLRNDVIDGSVTHSLNELRDRLMRVRVH